MDSEHPDPVVRAEKEFSACVLSHWHYCAAGVLIGMPVSMKRKSHIPFVVGGVVGSVADYYEAYYHSCLHLREKVEELRSKEELRKNT